MTNQYPLGDMASEFSSSEFKSTALFVGKTQYVIVTTMNNHSHLGLNRHTAFRHAETLWRF